MKRLGDPLDVYMHRGAGAYICGEETGLIESLEGKRGWPRIKPPFPAVEGAFRKPTVVNNIETLACVTHIVQRGADWFKTIGIPPDPKNPRDAGSYGPKLYCISGHVNQPCCVELPLGISVRDLVDKFGGGVWKGRKAKGCIPGGISMGIMTEKEFDTPLDFNGPGKVGCLGLGTAAVTIFDETTSIVDVLYNICRFFAHESCGQCTPCREGTGWMMKIIDRMRRGQGRKEDLDILDEVAKNDRHHAGHDDLRAGGRRRLADQECDCEIPSGAGRLYQERPEDDGVAGARWGALNGLIAFSARMITRGR